MCYSIGRKRGDCMCGNKCGSVDVSDLKHDNLLLLDEFGELCGQSLMRFYVTADGFSYKTETFLQDVSCIHKTGGH